MPQPEITVERVDPVTSSGLAGQGGTGQRTQAERNQLGEVVSRSLRAVAAGVRGWPVLVRGAGGLGKEQAPAGADLIGIDESVRAPAMVRPRLSAAIAVQSAPSPRRSSAAIRHSVSPGVHGMGRPGRGRLGLGRGRARARPARTWPFRRRRGGSGGGRPRERRPEAREREHADGDPPAAIRSMTDAPLWALTSPLRTCATTARTKLREQAAHAAHAARASRHSASRASGRQACPEPARQGITDHEEEHGRNGRECEQRGEQRRCDIEDLPRMSPHVRPSHR